MQIEPNKKRESLILKADLCLVNLWISSEKTMKKSYSRFLEYGICHIWQTWHIPYPSRHFKGIWEPGLTRQPSSAVNTRNPQTRSVFDQVVDLFSNWAISAWSSTQHIFLGGAISFIFPTLFFSASIMSNNTFFMPTFYLLFIPFIFQHYWG